MEVLGEISNFCRFCLSQDCELLMHLSSAIEDLSFSIQDIQQTTGISILESEVDCLTVCTKCINRIELAVDFRRSCIEGNVKFLQLFGHIIDKLRSSDIADASFEHAEYIKNPLRIEMVLQNEPENENILKGYNEPALLVEETQELFDERTSNGQEDCEDGNSSSEDLTPTHTSTLRAKRKIMNKRVDVIATSSHRKTKSNERIEDSEEDKANKPLKRKKSGKNRKQLCGICGALVFNLIDHTRSHTKENLLKCPHCPVQMTNSSNLSKHVRLVHEKIAVRSCEPCGKEFLTYNSYKSHLLSQHNIGERYQCEICLRIFNSTSSRGVHIRRMHFAEWKYECQICQKKFKDKKMLKRHERVHSTNAPFACSHCPKRFKSPYAKKTHEITHSGINFPCTLCTKVYRYKSLLSMHYRKCHPEECNSQPA
ncbi:zinc finger protein 58-like isoform X2 [Anopheles darlingi]|uniref:zinc finger protein 58-like isoform X2 n=1 Tax=Anopheles darlingi TaxID=43151 RepID=UPI0021000542|nr:zinc finger protein 58-like isoform X2 [Anopheles darlingi]